jgi:hypothetical protein
MKREFILSEIRRTAEENGGTPLGRRRFAKETGIQESDWFGKLWPNWGAALTEAGYEPNVKQGRLPDDHLLDHLARFILELGRFPVVAEMKMRARQHQEFPSHNTFRRLGGKGDLAKRLAEYLDGKPDFGPVLEICRAVAIELEAEGEEPEASPKDRADVEFGSVYLMRSGKHYKIGRTNAMGRRERELAIQLPERVKTIHVIQTDDPQGIEAYWHNRFADKRGNGEWFALTPEDVRAFKRRKFM